MISTGSNSSTFDVIWDVTLSLLIIRLAFFYFSLVFVTGCILGYIRVCYLIPNYNLKVANAELFEMPFMLLAVIFWARFVIERYDIPNITRSRLAVGLTALAFMLSAEVLGGVILEGKSLRQQILERDIIAGGTFAVSLVLFGLMPWMLMSRGVEDRKAGEKVKA